MRNFVCLTRSDGGHKSPLSISLVFSARKTAWCSSKPQASQPQALSWGSTNGQQTSTLPWRCLRLMQFSPRRLLLLLRAAPRLRTHTLWNEPALDGLSWLLPRGAAPSRASTCYVATSGLGLGDVDRPPPPLPLPPFSFDFGAFVVC